MATQKPIKDKIKDKIKDNDIPLLYLFVFKAMTEKFGKQDRILFTKQLLEIWRRCIHNVPRKYDYYILQEMCDYGMLEKITTQKYILFGSRANKKLVKLNDFFLW